jgi:superfamily II RNA helicase
MVKICSITHYPDENEAKYKEHFETFNYPLHIFQKWAIEGIAEGNHLLVCAPTGSGKTMPGEFAINYFHSKGKKLIYTTPIKALSNEKFYSFTQKYPHISIGLITGDIKTNPDADVLIMTTEILLNKLYQLKQNIQSSISFEMDIQHDLGCVVFDEIHFICDENRGHVWEQTIMMLPPHIQMVGLSATLDNPEKFASWLETRGELNPVNDKIVYLAKKQIRAVPLIHYSFITATNGVNKAIKDKATQEEIKKIINKPFIIQDEKNVFHDTQYQATIKTLKLFEKYDIRVKRQHVLNKVAEYLVEHEMLPALCYVFSRKQLEKCAEELTTNLLEFDSKIPYIVDRECEQIIRKLPNFQEYLHLPEYVNTIKMLRKGIGIHHAGLMPVLREMTEMLFAKGFIKMLFCTETMSVGINLPVKTTIFTDVNKFNGEIVRNLYSHEYTQSAGRAGRLGLDKIGHVIHLNNLFWNIDSVSYKAMMNGKPQKLTSKFKISYNVVLNLLENGENDLVYFMKKSMITGELDGQINQITSEITTHTRELDNIRFYYSNLNTPREIVEEYADLENKKLNMVNKKRKEIERRIEQIKDTYTFVEQDVKSFHSLALKETQLKTLENDFKNIQNYFNNGVQTVVHLLQIEGFIEGDFNRTSSLMLTLKGKIASQIRETHCLIFSQLFEDKTLDCLTSKQLAMLFSCFTNISVQEEYKESHFPKIDDIVLQNIIQQISKLYYEYQQKEVVYKINSGIDYGIHYDLLIYLDTWCNCENVEECKLVLQRLGNEKEIFLGEFVKALLKIQNISNEMEKIAEITGNISFLSKLREIPNMILKYVVTNQSLYV